MKLLSSGSVSSSVQGRSSLAKARREARKEAHSARSSSAPSA